MSRKARARLLYPTISFSERVAGLGVKGALLFTWLLAHCDDQGRYCGTPKKMKAEVVPLVDEFTVKDVEKVLAEMERVKLIIRYAEGDNQLIQVVDWWSFQDGLRVRYESRYPAPEGWKDRVRLPPEQTRDGMGKFRPGRWVDPATGEVVEPSDRADL
jgi:hypothetical protein